MHILHIITTINRGGAENHLATLVSHQILSGLKVTVVYLKGDGYWASSMRNLGVRVESLGIQRYWEIEQIFKLRGLIKTVAPDIVHAHMPPAELYARLALLFLSPSPVMVISKHNDEPFFRGFGNAVVGCWVGHGASRVIAISDAVKSYICKNLNIPYGKVTTVHYGIDISQYTKTITNQRRDIRTEWGIPNDFLVIGTVSRLVPQKALHILLMAYSRYRTLASKESCLVVVGSGPQLDELKAIASKNGLDGKVIWAGFREDIPAVMGAFDTFILTSSYEGFGLVLLEAMASACPIVASRTSAIPEIVQDGITGILCQPTDHDAFAQALFSLENDGLRTSLGAAGRERANIHFTIERMADSTKSIYKLCIP